MEEEPSVRGSPATNEEAFFDVLHTWFPTIYDIKFVMRSCKGLKGGLQDVADELGVRHLTFAMGPFG